MRVRVTHDLTGNIDGLSLDDLKSGHVYDVSTAIGSVLLAERWAEPADESETSEPTHPIQFAVRVAPPRVEMPRATAADRGQPNRKSSK